MKAIRHVLATIFFSTLLVTLQADWDPEVLELKDTSILEELNNPDYIALKDSIINYLQDSWCSKDRADLLLSIVVLSSPKICVEIGPFTGSTTLPILAGLQYLGKGKAYVIDSWSPEEAIRGLPASDKNTKWWSSLNMDAIKKEFYDMLTRWSLRSYCTVLPIPSQKAIKQMPSINFLHIDGNFSEEGALLDSNLYLPKVVSGGYIVLSNVHILVNKVPSKMKALMALYDECDLLCEVDDGETLLFRKN